MSSPQLCPDCGMIVDPTATETVKDDQGRLCCNKIHRAWSNAKENRPKPRSQLIIDRFLEEDFHGGERTI